MDTYHLTSKLVWDPNDYDDVIEDFLPQQPTFIKNFKRYVNDLWTSNTTNTTWDNFNPDNYISHLVALFYAGRDSFIEDQDFEGLGIRDLTDPGVASSPTGLPAGTARKSALSEIHQLDQSQSIGTILFT